MHGLAGVQLEETALARRKVVLDGLGQGVVLEAPNLATVVGLAALVGRPMDVQWLRLLRLSPAVECVVQAPSSGVLLWGSAQQGTLLHSPTRPGRLEVPDARIRRLAPADDLHVLTELLHRAYAPLAAAGMRFVASHQDAEVTRQRAAQGECYVAELEHALVGTFTLGLPGARAGAASEPSLYRRPDVATLSQFAVEPSLQGRGLGGRLLQYAEARARALGATTLALDTSQQAHDLIAWYQVRGYRIAGTCDWRPTTNYLSVLLQRQL